MKEGEIVDVVSDASTDTVLFADMPTKVQLKVTYTEPGIKGDTATNTLETGNRRDWCGSSRSVVHQRGRGYRDQYD